MKDRLEKSLQERLRAGGRPRRADPRYARPVVLTIPQALKAILVILIAGGLFTLSGCALLGLRPADSADLRLAAIVRAAVPNADALSQDELVGRLAVPRAVGELLAPLAATDPARSIVEPRGWLSGFRDGPPVVTTAERMRELGDVATTLASTPERDRSDLITSLLDLYLATRDPSSRMIIEVVGALPRRQRDSLAGSGILHSLLAAIADLPATKQQALADGRLQLLPDDPDRLRLIESIPRLEPSAVHLVNRLADMTDPNLRQALIYTVEQIRSGSPEVLHLLSLYWYRVPALMVVLATPSSTLPARSHHAR